MKVGIVVDGDAEYRALPSLLGRIASPHQVLNPLRADIQPFSPAERIARASLSRIRILTGKGAGHVIVLFDRESRTDCCGSFAARVRRAILQSLEGSAAPEVSVVLKNRAFENWLIADPSALRSLPALFPGLGNVNVPVTPFLADSWDGYRLIARLKGDRAYDKPRDARAILDVARPDEIGVNSRSFRRLLRVLGVAAYSDQSRRARTVAVG